MCHVRPTIAGLLGAVAISVCIPSTAQPVEVELRVEGGPVTGRAVIIDGRLLIAESFLLEGLGFAKETGETRVYLKWFGHRWVFSPGATTCSVDDQTVPLEVPVQAVGRGLYYPATTLLEPMGASVARTEDGVFSVGAPGAMVQSVRQGQHEDRVRMVVDLNGPAAFSHRTRPGQFVLHVRLPDGPEGRGTMLSQSSFAEKLVPTVTQSHSNGWAEITINHTSTQQPSVFTLHGPERIVVDFVRPEVARPPDVISPPKTPPTPVRPLDGVEWRSCNFATERGPVTGWLLRVNPADPAITVGPAAAGPTIESRRTVQSIARSTGAYAAVNGGYFSSKGHPLGMLLINGEWITTPRHQRAVLGFLADGSVQIRNVTFDGWVEFDGLGRLPLESVNGSQDQGDGVVVYTPRWGTQLLGNARKTRVVVRDGTVTAVVGTPETVAIPADGYVLSGLDRRAASLMRVEVGSRASLQLETSPKWPGLLHAVGGGPRLLAGGKVATGTYDERFRPDITASIRPRTAAGIDARGGLMLLVIDSINRGMSLGELAQVMLKLGAVDALNLDGGGSSSFFVDGRLMNAPSDGFARAVSEAIIVSDARGAAATR